MHEFVEIKYPVNKYVLIIKLIIKRDKWCFMTWAFVLIILKM